MSKPTLIHPDVRYRDSYVAALREGLNQEPEKAEDILLAETDFDAYLFKSNDPNRFVILPDGLRVSRVPQIDLWLVNDKEFLGRISLRPKLNASLKKRGGNIGYAIRASQRRKGYGSLMLNLALPRLKAMGLEKALITCSDDNIASIRIIEGAGGVLEDKVTLSGVAIPERRYWIEL